MLIPSKNKMILELIISGTAIATGGTSIAGILTGTRSEDLDNQSILNKRKTELVKRTSTNQNLPDLNHEPEEGLPINRYPISKITEEYSAPINGTIPWLFGGYIEQGLRKRVMTDLAEKLKEVENLEDASSTNRNEVDNKPGKRSIVWNGHYHIEYDDDTAFDIPSNYKITFKPFRNTLKISIEGPEEFVREIETYIKEAEYADRS